MSSKYDPNYMNSNGKSGAIVPNYQQNFRDFQYREQGRGQQMHHSSSPVYTGTLPVPEGWSRGEFMLALISGIVATGLFIGAAAESGSSDESNTKSTAVTVLAVLGTAAIIMTIFLCVKNCCCKKNLQKGALLPS